MGKELFVNEDTGELIPGDEVTKWFLNEDVQICPRSHPESSRVIDYDAALKIAGDEVRARTRKPGKRVLTAQEMRKVVSCSECKIGGSDG